MRVLFSTTAGAGHFGPMVPIAQACAAAGHDVVVAAPASFAAAVAESGLTHRPFADAPADQMGATFARLPSLSREEGERVVVADVFGRLDAQAALPGLRETVADWRPDVVVRDPAEVGALVAAAGAGLPQVQVAIDIGGFMASVADWLDDPIRELEQRAGLTDLRGADRVRRTPTFSSVPETLDRPADGTAPTAATAPVWRYRVAAPATGPALPAEWGDPAAPLVYVSFGSVAGSLGHLAAVYPAVVAALADQPVRVLLTTGHAYDPAGLEPLPPNTFATRWWPQAAAMREAALVVGHGGFGTTMTAVAAGVPQLVLPLFSSDQFQNAEKVAATGLGERLLGGPEAVPEVPRLVTALLGDPAYAATARRMAAETAALPGVASTVAVLEERAGRGPGD